jgi:hypothetical protein
VRCGRSFEHAQSPADDSQQIPETGKNVKISTLNSHGTCEGELIREKVKGAIVNNRSKIPA